MIPFVTADKKELELNRGDSIYIKGIREAVASGVEKVSAKLYSNCKVTDIELLLEGLSKDQRDILFGRLF